MTQQQKLRMYRVFSGDAWLSIHNRAAPDYQPSEWVRENVFGIGRLRRKLFQKATGSVLDVACGYGNNLPCLVNTTHITAVDASPVMLEMAREQALQLRMAVEFRRENAEDLRFADHSFDTVISALSTCSFLNPIRALREMGRVCQPDGRILLLEHGRSQWDWLARYQDKQVAQMVERGGCHWNQEPQELVKAAGLRIISAQRSLTGMLHALEVAPA